MLALLRNDFDHLVSIELSPRLARRARRRFAEDDRIEILEGDSGDLLGEVLQRLARPAVLWLDGHYSGPLTARGDVDTPLLREIQEALRHGTEEDVVLVDDARLLDSDPAYPRLETFRELIVAQRPTWGISLDVDILHAGPGIGANESRH